MPDPGVIWKETFYKHTLTQEIRFVLERSTWNKPNLRYWPKLQISRVNNSTLCTAWLCAMDWVLALRLSSMAWLIDTGPTLLSSQPGLPQCIAYSKQPWEHGNDQIGVKHCLQWWVVQIKLWDVLSWHYNMMGLTTLHMYP